MTTPTTSNCSTLAGSERYIAAAVPGCHVVSISDEGLEVFLPEDGFVLAVNDLENGSWEVREGYEDPDDSGVVNYESLSVVYPTLTAATFGAVDVLRRKEQDR